MYKTLEFRDKEFELISSQDFDKSESIPSFNIGEAIVISITIPYDYKSPPYNSFQQVMKIKNIEHKFSQHFNKANSPVSHLLTLITLEKFTP